MVQNAEFCGTKCYLDRVLWYKTIYFVVQNSKPALVLSCFVVQNYFEEFCGTKFWGFGVQNVTLSGFCGTKLSLFSIFGIGIYSKMTPFLKCFVVQNSESP